MAKILLKKILIQEGITDFVKNNWGKGLVAASGLVLASAGAFGESAQKTVSLGGDKLNQFMKDAGDWSKQAVDKVEAKYGDAVKDLPNRVQNTVNNQVNNQASTAHASTEKNSDDQYLMKTDHKPTINDMKSQHN